MSSDIERLIKQNNFKFQHSLGQNFILDEAILEDIADASGVGISDHVLEIGAGAGSLTRMLCKRAGKVLALEIDKNLMPMLSVVLSPFDNVHVENADVMKADLASLIEKHLGEGDVHVVANLPYYITTPVIMMLLESDLPIRSLTIMVQKEVAQRIAAKTKSKDYGALTLAVQYRMSADIALEVTAKNFMPPPKVDSSVVVLRRLEKPPVDTDEKLFFRLVKACFAMRRKTLNNNLCASFSLSKEKAAAIIEKAGFKPTVRGEELSITDIAALAEAFKE